MSRKEPLTPELCGLIDLLAEFVVEDYLDEIKMLDEWARRLFLQVPEQWEQGAVGALCTALCEWYVAGQAEFDRLHEREQQEQEHLEQKAKAARCARRAALDAEAKQKDADYAEQFARIRARAETAIARATEVQIEGIIFEPKTQAKKKGGRPVEPITALIVDLNAILSAGGVTVERDRAKYIERLLHTHFPEHTKQIAWPAIITRLRQNAVKKTAPEN